MLTLSSWLKTLLSMDVRDQVKALVLSGFLFMLITPLILISWERPPTASKELWSHLPVSIVSEVETWNDDNSMLTFITAYTDPNQNRHTERVYIKKEDYPALEITSAAPLYANIAESDDLFIIESLITGTNTIVYDQKLRKLIVEINNQKTLESTAFFLTIGLLMFIGAAALHYINKRHTHIRRR